MTIYRVVMLSLHFGWTTFVILEERERVETNKKEDDENNVTRSRGTSIAS